MGREVFEDLETCPQLWVSPRLARLCSLAVCGSNGTSFEDDLTLGAEGTNHPWARRGVPSCGVTVTPWAELPWWRQGSWGQAGSDPGGQLPLVASSPGGFWWGWAVPKLCIPLGSGLWPPERTSPRVASVGPIPKTPHLTPCRLSAPFSQLFCYRGATRPRAGEVSGPGGGWCRGAGGTVPVHPAGSIPFTQPRPPLCRRALWNKHLNLGHSMASSALSSLTTKTSSR